MKSDCLLLAMALIIFHAGCDSSAPSAVDSSSQDSHSEGHDHDGHDHDGHGEHAGHDHEGHHEEEAGHERSLSETVQQIKESGDKIIDAFSSGNPDSAHHDLHEIGHVIESLPELAKKSDFTSAQQDSIREITEGLMDAFGELDGTLHGGDSVQVSDISKTVSEHMEKLQAML